MSRLNPGYKFLTLLIASLVLSITYNIRLNIVVFIVSFAATACTRSVNKKKLLLRLLPFFLTAAGMFMSGFLFSSAGDVANAAAAGERAVYVTSWDSALKLSSRVLAFGGIGILFALTTNSMDFIMSLMQQFHLPPKFAYGLLAAYHFFPVVHSEYEIVRSALAVRGIKTGPLSKKRFFPMLVHAFERSESIAMAMESRGFDSDAGRGQAFPVPLGKIDFVFLFTVNAGVIAGIVWI
ncbi:MAG: energy-coupling factor transporter transmembrane protein EcfT [Synergistaceae bacterium]|jgi:energy-coupling factor transporter transmembrane protein EcfT|nr:energy-coupling factor transporter transmembrane protein EcfT [Synergistaceae bacterium]